MAFIATYGYAWVSSSSQSLAIQQEALRASGCNVIRAETRIGTNLDGWTELDTFIQFVRAVDFLNVTRIDGLARSISDLAAIAKRLEVKGASLRLVEQPVVWSWLS